MLNYVVRAVGYAGDVDVSVLSEWTGHVTYSCQYRKIRTHALNHASKRSLAGQHVLISANCMKKCINYLDIVDFKVCYLCSRCRL